MNKAIPSAPPPRLTHTIPGSITYDPPLTQCEDCTLTCPSPNCRPFGLSLGCGPDWSKHYDQTNTIALDVLDFGQHIIHNLEFPIPLPSQSCNIINAIHVFEHVHNWPNLLAECYRVLSHEGVLTVTTPNYKSINAYADPTHCNVMTQFSIDFALDASVTIHPSAWPYPSFQILHPVQATSEELQWNLLKT